MAKTECAAPPLAAHLDASLDQMSETAAFPFPALSAFADGPLADAASWAWDSLDRDIATMPEGLRPFAESNDWKNALVLPVSVRDQMPRVLASWLRNLVAGSALYYVLGLVWCALIYGCFRSRIFPKGGVPTLSAQLAQIWVSQKALVMYTLMPTIGEWLAENGLSRCYYSIEEIGGIVPYLAWTALYLFLIEFCVYWVHRALHHPLIKWLHADHHIYNTGDSLSPWAGLAFHPVDGMMQASPYVFLLVLIPVHFWTFMVMLVSLKPAHMRAAAGLALRCSAADVRPALLPRRVGFATMSAPVRTRLAA